MCAGERRRVIIPPSWGYGERGSSSGKIPGSAVLVFDVRLIDFHNPTDVPKITTIGSPPEDCIKLVEGQILEIDYHAALEDGTLIDDFKDLKIVFSDDNLIFGLFSVLKVSCMKIYCFETKRSCYRKCV